MTAKEKKAQKKETQETRNSVELDNKSLDELHTLLNELAKEKLNLMVQKSVGQLNAPHRLRSVRRNIARAKTLIHMHNIIAKADAAIAMAESNI